MIWLITQMWFLLAAAFIVGLAIGWWLRRGGAKHVETSSVNADVSGSLAVDHNTLKQPILYASPLHGAKDDLTQIIGIDDEAAARLNDVGVFYINQIAEWDGSRARWIEDRLAAPGRIERERWIDQARSVLDLAGKLTGAER